jgi:electron transfer flavoprotein alpha/beta subunit
VAGAAIVRENAVAIPLADSRWQHVKAIVSKQTLADASTGNVPARTGVELDSGQVAYVSSRLKISDGEIVEIEISFDDRDNVVAENVIRLVPVLTLIVPPENRSPRQTLERIGRSYFQTLTDHRN